MSLQTQVGVPVPAITLQARPFIYLHDSEGIGRCRNMTLTEGALVADQLPNVPCPLLVGLVDGRRDIARRVRRGLRDVLRLV